MKTNRSAVIHALLLVAGGLVVQAEGQLSPADASRVDSMMTLAQAQFGALSPADSVLFRSVVLAQPARYLSGDARADSVEYAADWGAERRLGADRIEWLCTNRRAVGLVGRKGLEIEGAAIEGVIDLAFADIPFPLQWWKCYFRDEIDLTHAKVKALYLYGSHIVNPGGYALSADGLEVAGDVFLSDGFQAEGEVRLLGGRIGGDLICIEGHFSNADGDALNAAGLEVERYVYFRGSTSIKGRVGFVGASVGEHFQWREIASIDSLTLDLRGAKESWLNNIPLCLSRRNRPIVPWG